MDVSLSELRELVMDGEAWRDAIHGVTESDMTEQLNWTELNDRLTRGHILKRNTGNFQKYFQDLDFPHGLVEHQHSGFEY